MSTKNGSGTQAGAPVSNIFGNAMGRGVPAQAPCGMMLGWSRALSSSVLLPQIQEKKHKCRSAIKIAAAQMISRFNSCLIAKIDRFTLLSHSSPAENFELPNSQDTHKCNTCNVTMNLAVKALNLPHMLRKDLRIAERSARPLTGHYAQWRD